MKRVRSLNELAKYIEYNMQREEEERQEAKQRATLEYLRETFEPNDWDELTESGNIWHFIPDYTRRDQYAVAENIEMEIARTPRCRFLGAKLPKGAIFGYDKDGPFFCKSYKVRGKTGYYKGMPRLVIYRTSRAHDNWRKWEPRIEASLTTDAILDMYYMHEEACEIEYEDPYADAGKVASKMELRPAYDEVHYTGITWLGHSDKPSGATFCVIVGENSIEEMIKKKNW